MHESGDANTGEFAERGRRPAKPLVFISHDSRDAKLAEAFENLLTDATGGMLKAFRSSDRTGTAGIEFGTEWYKAIMERLDSASDVVALLTTRSIGRPWILYEAGVAKGKLGTTVFGLALGTPLATASLGPFAQFQNSGDDEESLVKVVRELISRNLPEASPRNEAIAREVKAFKETVTPILAAEEPTQPVRDDDLGVARLFEELKVMIRELPAAEASARPAGRLVASHVFSLISQDTSSSDPRVRSLGWGIATKLIDDTAPMLSDSARSVGLALRTNDGTQLKRTARRLREDLDLLGHRGRLTEYSLALGIPRESVELLEELPYFLQFVLSNFEDLAERLPSRPAGIREKSLVAKAAQE